MNRKLSVKVSAGVVGIIALALVLYSVHERIEPHKMGDPKVVTIDYVQRTELWPVSTLSIGGYTNIPCRGTVLFSGNLYPETTTVTCVNLYIAEFPDVQMVSRPGPEKTFIPRRSDLLLSYDTCRLPNGNYNAKLIIGNPKDVDEGFDTETVSFRTNNTISEFYAEQDLVTARLTTSSADWRIDVLRGSGRSPETLDFQLVRSIKGRGRDIRWRWDEKNNLGIHVKDRSATLGWVNKHIDGCLASAYFYRITAMQGGKILQQTEPSSSNDFVDNAYDLARSSRRFQRGSPISSVR